MLVQAFVFWLGLSAAYASGPTLESPSRSASTSKVSVAWYAGWHAEILPLSKVSWSKYTHLTFAFAETTPNANTLDGPDPTLLTAFVTEARKNNVKALVSIGGWTGSRGFSLNVGSAANRTTFVKTITNLATKFKLDGIDFDWEYPGAQGIGCNAVNSKDTANFLLFLQELRRHPAGASLILTAATATYPFIGPDGSSVKDVSGFAQALDWIALMNYDLWGPWSATVGPNAALNDTCTTRASGSAVSAVSKWRAAGVPVDKLVLGVPAYGHSFRVKKADAYEKGTTTLALYPLFVATDTPLGDSTDDPGYTDVCGVWNGPSGFINYWGLKEKGFIDAKGAIQSGIGYRFDTCSQTPFVYNPNTEIMVSYDDAQSFAAKGRFIKEQNLRGFAIWEAAGDMDNILLNSIRGAAGL